MLIPVWSSPHASPKPGAAAAAENVNISLFSREQPPTNLVEGHPRETPDARADQVSPLLDLAKLL